MFSEELFPLSNTTVRLSTSPPAECPNSFDGARYGGGEECCVVLGASVELVDERKAQPPDDGSRQPHLTKMMAECLVVTFLVELRGGLLGQVAEEVGRVVDEPIQRDRELVEGVRPQSFFDMGNCFHGEPLHGIPEPLSCGAGNGNGKEAGKYALVIPSGDPVLAPGLTDPIDGSEHEILSYVEIRRGDCGIRVDQRNDPQLQSLLVKGCGETELQVRCLCRGVRHLGR